MIQPRKVTRSVLIFVLVVAASLIIDDSAIADDEPTVAFPDKWMIRAGAYFIDNADTTLAVNSPVGLGAIINYQRDLGGDDSDTIPRIDGYYRFNDRHRIDFTWFQLDRKGERQLAIDLQIGEENFIATETIFSDIKYELYRLGYNYSFYHSPKVELSFTAGLNITSYDLEFRNSAGDKVETAGVSVPLPVFGLRMGYAITPRWYVRYVTEAFFIEIEDAFKGALLNFELNTEYKIFNNFSLGIGVARLGIDADIEDDGWNGRVTDGYRGFTAFGTFYF